MKVIIEIKGAGYKADLSKPIDISIAQGEVKCFYAPDVVKTPYTSGDFVGSVKSGAPVNFFNVQLNPHGNGTHTECLGHITAAQESVNQTLQKYHFHAYLLTVDLETLENGDRIISKEAILKNLPEGTFEAIVIRTSPNMIAKKTMDYSGTNPPYLTSEAMQLFVDRGVQHLLIDTPSVDREEDDGILAAHHIFWGLDQDENTLDASRRNATITEMVFVDDKYADAWYLLNLQIAPLELDASPSKPTLYELTKEQ